MISNIRMYQNSKKFLRLSKVLLILWALRSTCHSIPLNNPKIPWYDGDGIPRIYTSCDPITWRCLELQPIAQSRAGDYLIVRDSEFDRTQAIPLQNEDKASDTWQITTAEGLEDGNNGNQMSVGRLAKKDVFMSRGWGTGGMPFSVLYMSPRMNHQSLSGTTQVEMGKNAQPIRKSSESPSQRINQTNRVALRNGGSGQPRRHYSIIPHLFISYGWGPSGK